MRHLVPTAAFFILLIIAPQSPTAHQTNRSHTELTLVPSPVLSEGDFDLTGKDWDMHSWAFASQAERCTMRRAEPPRKL